MSLLVLPCMLPDVHLQHSHLEATLLLRVSLLLPCMLFLVCSPVWPCCEACPRCSMCRIKKQEKETGISQAMEADDKKKKKKCASCRLCPCLCLGMGMRLRMHCGMPVKRPCMCSAGDCVLRGWYAR